MRKCNGWNSDRHQRNASLLQNNNHKYSIAQCKGEEEGSVVAHLSSDQKSPKLIAILISQKREIQKRKRMKGILTGTREILVCYKMTSEKCSIAQCTGEEEGSVVALYF